MLTVSTLLWDANQNSRDFSRDYSEEWVEKLFRGFQRNLTGPFEFICFTDYPREFGGLYIGQERISAKTPNYSNCIEPFRLGAPMILCGLDTVILRNIDHLAEYCLTARKIALPRDPYCWERACNGVVLCPAGNEAIYNDWRGENDMTWLRSRPHNFIDDIFGGSVKSYKGHVRGETYGGRPVGRGIEGVDVVYFHGRPKQHELGHEQFIREHWV